MPILTVAYIRARANTDIPGSTTSPLTFAYAREGATTLGQIYVNTTPVGGGEIGDFSSDGDSIAGDAVETPAGTETLFEVSGDSQYPADNVQVRCYDTVGLQFTIEFLDEDLNILGSVSVPPGTLTDYDTVIYLMPPAPSGDFWTDHHGTREVP